MKKENSDLKKDNASLLQWDTAVDSSLFSVPEDQPSREPVSDVKVQDEHFQETLTEVADVSSLSLSEDEPSVESAADVDILYQQSPDTVKKTKVDYPCVYKS